MPAAGWNNLAHFELCRKARNHSVKVMINGQGADELFAGYTAYLPYWWHGSRWFNRIKTLINIQYCGLTLAEAGRLLLRHTLQGSMGPKRAQQLALKRKSFAELYGPAIGQYLTEPAPQPANLNAALQQDYYGQKLGQMLQWEDRNSMAAGLESRNPFADDRNLAALAWSIPPQEKITDGWTKHPLRLVAAKYLPAALAWRRDKKGFTVTDRRFTLTAWPELKTWLQDVPENWINQAALKAVTASPEKCDDAMLAFLFRLACASRFIQLTQSRWP
jgi:asparagine synthase (glutamine-hydrolysing)